MSLSPKKRRTLSRQPSSPSLAVGLPPPLPDGIPFSPSSTSTTFKRARRVHRGDVESSSSSSDDPDMSEDEKDKGWVVTSEPHHSLSMSNTPKRKVVGVMDAPMTVGRGAKKPSLQERLAAAAKVKKSRSQGDGLSLSASASGTALVAAENTEPRGVKRPSSGSSGDVSKSDKVVVCVRIKPTTSAFLTQAYELTPTSLTLSDAHPNVQKRGGKSGREDEYTYTVDKLLQFPSTTPELYSTKIAPLVEKAMNGFNSTIFAYGQTGSGKSFTMTGTSTELGIIPCAVDGVFDAINAEPDRAFLLRVSYIEIYNETLRDLLNFKRAPLKDEEKPAIHFNKVCAPPFVQWHSDGVQGKVWVEPLVEEIVSTPQDVVDLLEKGNAGRKIGATDWNDRSSRSHCVFTIVIESRPRDGAGDDDIRLSRLDLAGSEKAVTDMERRGEGKHINQSLLALREVINKLTEKKRAHIPYRNSKLTHLLENALGGDSNICVICTLSAEEEHAAETLETLKFAGRCSQVETKAKKNVLQSSERALIQAKDKEIEVLKRRLQVMAGQTQTQPSSSTLDQSEQVADLAESVADLEARKAKLTNQLAKLNGEILTSEMPRSNAGLPLSPPRPKRRRISDFAMLGSGRLGLGTPKSKVANERRAVSSMMRLPEEDMQSMVGAMDSADSGAVSFDHDRAVAALRRALANKAQELESANRELSVALAKTSELPLKDERIASLDAELQSLGDQLATLQTASADTATQHDAALREFHVQLESTRSELVATIEEKTSKIDQLEATVLDLRKSREDLVIEDQQRLDELKSELDAAIAEAAKGKSESLAANDKLQAEFTAAMNDKEALRKTSDDAKAEVGNLQLRLETLSTQHAQQSAELTTARDELLKAQDEVKTGAQQNEQQILTIDQLRNDVEIVRREKDEADRMRDRAKDDLEQYQRAAMASEASTITELREELAKARGRADGLEKDLQVERDQRAQAGREMGKREVERLSLVSDAEKREAERLSLVSHVESLRAEKAAVDTTLRARDDESNARATAEGGDVRVRELETQVADLRRQLEGRDQAFRDLEAKLASELTARKKVEEELAAEGIATTEMETVLKAEQAARDKAARDLLAVQKESEVVQKQLTDLRGEVSQTTATSAVSAKAAAEQIRTLQKQLEEAARDVNTAQQAIVGEKQKVETAQRELDAAKKEVADFRARATQLETRSSRAEKEVEALNAAQGALPTTKQLDDLRRALEASDRDLKNAVSQAEREAASAKAASMELDLLRASTASLPTAAQLAQLEQALVAARQELDKAREDSLASNERITALKTELMDIKSRPPPVPLPTSSSGKWRHSTPAPFQDTSDTGSLRGAGTESLRQQVLTSATTGVDSTSASARLRTRETEEIERLEKVIEAQQAMIDDQREKIVFWQMELERQREIVRVLTSEPNASPSNTNTASPGSLHTKSKSLALPSKANAGMDSPSPSVPHKTSSRTRSHIPSTFTAHNLALPCASVTLHGPATSPGRVAAGLSDMAKRDSPSPLPSHPSQWSNTSSKKGRRITIEHDMGLLEESSRVLQAKKIFDSPGKPTARSDKPNAAMARPRRG
ncbi:hypothetical protein JCM24511_03957 [Saitozyma sp. JCM 24511]|nr:hypothetical protein JCM24511_03957 [Saitozyma sp. JCM 24511]